MVIHTRPFTIMYVNDLPLYLKYNNIHLTVYADDNAITACM